MYRGIIEQKFSDHLHYDQIKNRIKFLEKIFSVTVEERKNLEKIYSLVKKCTREFLVKKFIH